MAEPDLLAQAVKDSAQLVKITAQQRFALGGDDPGRIADHLQHPIINRSPGLAPGMRDHVVQNLAQLAAVDHIQPAEISGGIQARGRACHRQRAADTNLPPGLRHIDVVGAHEPRQAEPQRVGDVVQASEGAD